MAIEINVNINATDVSAALNNFANTLVSLIVAGVKAPEETGKELLAGAVNTEKTPKPAPAPAAVPVASAPAAPAPMPTVPTAAQSYSQDQLALAASGLMDAGKIAELQKLLAAFNVPSLVQLPKEQYGAFATKLRELGAKI